jgi:hypothetical protein
MHQGGTSYQVTVDNRKSSYIMAAIDRVIHHSVILDMMDVESYRAKEANSLHSQATEQSEGALKTSLAESESATLIRSTGKNDRQPQHLVK